MGQKKLTETYPERRASSRVTEKRKLPTTSDSSSGGAKSLRRPKLPKVDENSLESFRKALDTSSPEHLPGREAQILEVKQFLSSRLAQKRPGSLYISGAPGTGKTAVVNYVLEEIVAESKKRLGFFQVFINCMCKRSATEIYELIWEKVKPAKKSSRAVGSLKEKLEARLLTTSKSANMVVIILDEMDQILKGSNEVLYSLFEWARAPDSKLILVGIANALDLTVRHLPFLHLNSSPMKQPKNGSSQPVNQCQTLSFPPYQREDIEKILEERMEQVGHNIFDPSAIKFVAAKVAASTGDARKALHACKEAMGGVGKQEQREVLKPAVENEIPLTSVTPKKICIRNDKIGVAAMSKALQIKQDEGPLPLQQITILAALLKMHQDAPNTREPLVDGVNRAIPVSTLYKQYRKICSLKGFSWIEESELPLVCEVLQDRSLVSVANTGNASVKKLSFGSSKFGSPSAGSSKIGIMFDPRRIEGIIMTGDMKTLFG